MTRWSPVALCFAVALGCQPTHDDTARAPAPVVPSASAAPIASTASAATTPDAGAPEPPLAALPLVAPLLTDAEVGALIAKLSERGGNFPSENYVSNEASLLDVAPALRAPELHGRGYVGVGPEQSYTYLALLEPRVSYIVDIRRSNLLEHLLFRGCFEAGKTRAEFLTALLARHAKLKNPEGGDGADDYATLDDAFRAAPADHALRTEGVARTKAVFDRLGVAHSAADDREIAQLHDAFAKYGLSIAYTMMKNDWHYPTLGESFAARDPDGKPGSFMATEASYERVRRLVIENRVIPVVGDFGGKQALLAVADDMRARGITLGVFYASNVEQYLFDQKTYPSFVENVRAMPRDDRSLVVRVWFDSGKRHPAQRPGLRTTQLSLPIDAFLARATKRPFAYYWDVVNQKESQTE